MLTKEKLYDLASRSENQKMVVVCPYDDATIESAISAVKSNYCDAVFVGEEAKILNEVSKEELDSKGIEVVGVEDDLSAITKAVDMLVKKEGSVIMKGLIDTSVFLKGILKEKNLMEENAVLSHVGFLLKENEKGYIVSDAAINIKPNLEQKKRIIENAVKSARALGIEKPNVANICAKEKVYEKMESTIIADELRKMNERGEIKNCIVSGPLQFDAAISKNSCEIKGVKDPVGGNADILICDSIEPANVLVKALKYLGGYLFSGVVIGSKVPIVLTSRADDFEEKLLSIVIGCNIAKDV